MSARRRPPVATCGRCGTKLKGATLDELNAQLKKHYRKCK